MRTVSKLCLGSVEVASEQREGSTKGVVKDGDTKATSGWLPEDDRKTGHEGPELMGMMYCHSKTHQTTAAPKVSEVKAAQEQLPKDGPVGLGG